MREDKSAPVIREMVEAAGYAVVGQTVMSDARQTLTKRLNRFLPPRFRRTAAYPFIICHGKRGDMLLWFPPSHKVLH